MKCLTSNDYPNSKRHPKDPVKTGSFNNRSKVSILQEYQSHMYGGCLPIYFLKMYMFLV